MQLLADPLRLDGQLADQPRPQQAQGALDQGQAGGGAADAGHPWSVSTCTRWLSFRVERLLPPALRDPAPQGIARRLQFASRPSPDQTLRRWCAGRASGPCWPPPAPASSSPPGGAPARRSRQRPLPQSTACRTPGRRHGAPGARPPPASPPAGLEVLQQQPGAGPAPGGRADQAERPGAAVELQAPPARPPRSRSRPGKRRWPARSPAAAAAKRRLSPPRCAA